MPNDKKPSRGPLTPEEKAQILGFAGHSVREVARLVGVSTGAVVATRRGSHTAHAVNTPVHAVNTPVALPTEDEVGETSDPRTLDAWLAVAGRAAVAAENRGDPVALARFGSLATAILSAKAKAEPPPVVALETRPDMVAWTKAGVEKVCGRLERFIAEAEAAK
jgi:hypothetical protein